MVFVIRTERSLWLSDVREQKNLEVVRSEDISGKSVQLYVTVNILVELSMVCS